MKQTIKKGKWCRRFAGGVKNVGQRMKNAFIKTKAKADQQAGEQKKQNNTSPTAYAENALTGRARAGADKAGRTLNRQGKKAVRNLPLNIRSGKQAIKTAQKSIKTAKQGQAAIKTAKAAKQSAQTAAKTTQKAAISAVKGIVVLIAASGWIAVVIIVLICAFEMILAFLIGGNGDMSELPSDFSFSSSVLE